MSLALRKQSEKEPANSGPSHENASRETAVVSPIGLVPAVLALAAISYVSQSQSPCYVPNHIVSAFQWHWCDFPHEWLRLDAPKARETFWHVP